MRVWLVVALLVAVIGAGCSTDDRGDSFVSDAELVDLRSLVVDRTGVVDLSLSDHRALGDRVCTLGPELTTESAAIIDEFELDRYATEGTPTTVLRLVGRLACPERMADESPLEAFAASAPSDRVRSDTPPAGYPDALRVDALVDGLGYASTGRWVLTGSHPEPGDAVVDDLVGRMSDLGWRTDLTGPVEADEANLWSVDIEMDGFSGVLDVLEPAGTSISRVLLVIAEPS